MQARRIALSRAQSLQRKAQQKGNAVLFGLLGLVIGGIVIAVGINQYQEAERSAAIQETVGQINTIVGNVKQNYGQYAYAGLTTAMAVGSQVIPQSTHTGAATAENKHGGAITLVDNAANLAATALLTYNAIPSSQCTAIVNGIQALGRQVLVNGNIVKPTDGQVNLVDLNTNCIANPTANIGLVIGRT